MLIVVFPDAFVLKLMPVPAIKLPPILPVIVEPLMLELLTATLALTVPTVKLIEPRVSIVPFGAAIVDASNTHTLFMLILPVDELIILILPVDELIVDEFRVDELIIDTLSGLDTSPVFIMLVIPAVVVS